MTTSRIPGARQRTLAAASSILPPRPSHEAMQQGAEWYALLRSDDVTAADRLQWQHWLDASDEHRRAWQYVESISSSFAPLHAAPDPQRTAGTLLTVNRRMQQRRKTLAGLAVLGSGMLGWALWRNRLLPPVMLAWTADYRTATGEMRQITLPDRGRLWLNTATAVNLHFTDRLRRIELVQGEITVDTAADVAQRPFVVDSRHGRMQALGTRFTVRQFDDATLLAVQEGAVRIQPRQVAEVDAAVRIDAGRQVRFDEHGTVGESVPLVARPAWMDGMFEVHDMSLRELAAELGRYWNGHIGVADEVAERRVFGSFPLDDIPATLQLLAADQPVLVRQTLPWWISIEARR